MFWLTARNQPYAYVLLSNTSYYISVFHKPGLNSSFQFNSIGDQFYLIRLTTFIRNVHLILGSRASHSCDREKTEFRSDLHCENNMRPTLVCHEI